jgi:hypothetical protein
MSTMSGGGSNDVPFQCSAVVFNIPFQRPTEVPKTLIGQSICIEGLSWESSDQNRSSDTSHSPGQIVSITPTQIKAFSLLTSIASR